ncbi:hypothetical protein PL11201_770033 [Planktothrix sp. PCC 11201]|uniref:hypothetical protein n=1 Tax=Planktothrix sp. PCC 11201 TaxID=1729650 RepID=UPI00091BF15A|nr:hypothetical protein [Planktothrix sp. PCC 11201]SKB15663.1 hypothetical protein PL11201_770033 [Planktothrix sp. PCC 11201]
MLRIPVQNRNSQEIFTDVNVSSTECDGSASACRIVPKAISSRRLLFLDKMIDKIGLAYVDDDQVTDIIVRKRNLSGNFKIENMTSTLAEGFARGNQFLHIVVLDAPDQEVLT